MGWVARLRWRYLGSVLVLVALTAGNSGYVAADVHRSWEWEECKRILTFSFDLNAGDKQKIEKADPHLSNVATFYQIRNGDQWMRWTEKAAEKWNDAQTGWVLIKVQEGGMLRIVSGKWDDGTLGQLFNWGWVCWNGNEFWTRGVIVIDTSRSWDETDPTKFHPVRAIMHEFGHAFLLDHRGTSIEDIMYGSVCVSGKRNTVCGRNRVPLRSTELSQDDVINAIVSAGACRECDGKKEDFGPKALWPPDVTQFDFIGLLVFNPAQPPVDDERVRRALECAIERDVFSDLLQGHGFDWVYPLYSIVPYQYAAWLEWRGCDRGLVEALDLLQRAGFSSGFTIDLVCPYSDMYQTVAYILQAEFARINVTLKINLVPFSLFYYADTRLLAPITLIIFSTYSTAHALDFIYRFTSPLHGVGEWQETFNRIKELLDLAQEAPSEAPSREARDECWLEVQRLLLANHLVVPLFVGVLSTEPVEGGGNH